MRMRGTGGRAAKAAAGAALICLLAAAGAWAGTLEQIDRAVEEIGAFVQRSVPDQAGSTIVVAPFLSDRLGRNLLGDRLKSELELHLAGAYHQARVKSAAPGSPAAAAAGRPAAQPPAGAGPGVYTVAGEIQSYPEAVRILCRIVRPDGSLGGGTRVDIPSTAELRELLVAPQAVVPARPGAAGQEEPSGAASDPFEPDDVPGFEVEVSGERSSYVRYLSPGDIDRFRFYLPQSTPVAVEMKTDMDTQLLFYREGENIPFQVRDNRSQEGGVVRVELPEGYYVLEVLAYDFDVQGSYVLTIDLSGSAGDPYEPDDSMEEAKPLLPDSVQERTLSAGDQDWVELSFSVPGFYLVYTGGDQVDTALTLFQTAGRPWLTDQDSGEWFNSLVAVFLGPRRTFARVAAQNPVDTGAYTLHLEKIEPRQVYPDETLLELAAGGTPAFLKLRVLQPGSYTVARQGSLGPVEVRLFSLPEMGEVAASEDAYSLGGGDYLLEVSSAEQQQVRLCVGPQSRSAECLRKVQE